MLKQIMTMATAGLLLALTSGSLTGAEEKAAAKPADKAKAGKVAYLGVGVSQVQEALSAQLHFPRGVGLLVGHVDPKSNAAGKLEEHDVLHKLNDQLLINAPQLATLVETFRPGDEITLGVVRKGKPLTVKVALGEKDASAATTIFGLPSTQVQVLPPVIQSFSAPDVAESVKRLEEHLKKSGLSAGVEQQILREFEKAKKQAQDARSKAQQEAEKLRRELEEKFRNHPPPQRHQQLTGFDPDRHRRLLPNRRGRGRHADR